MNAPRLFLAVCPLVVFFSFISFLFVFDMIECHRLWLSRPSASLSHSPKAVFFFLAALERAGVCERRPLPSAHTWTHPYLWPSFCFLILQVSFFIEKKHRKRQGGREKTKEKEASQGSCCCCSNYSENITSGNVVNTWALLVNHNK
jgi:hypothetical protein